MRSACRLQPLLGQFEPVRQQVGKDPGAAHSLMELAAIRLALAAIADSGHHPIGLIRVVNIQPLRKQAFEFERKS